MRITQHTDYALRVLMYVGSNAARLVTIAEIAERFGISRTHLMKVVNRLVRAGFLSGKRGKGGGLSLAQAPGQIRIGDVFRAMEADRGPLGQGASTRRRQTRLGDGVEAVSGASLAARGDDLDTALREALAEFLAVLDRNTLADLLGVPTRERLVTLMRAQPLLSVQR